MLLAIIQQEIYTGSIAIRTHSCDSSLSPSAPYLATPHLSLLRIGCKHIPSYFAFPITAAGCVYLKMDDGHGTTNETNLTMFD